MCHKLFSHLFTLFCNSLDDIIQVPLENSLPDDVNDHGEAYELLHMLNIETDTLTSLQASVIHIAVSRAGNCSLGAFGVELPRAR